MGRAAAQQIELPSDRPAIVALRPGVAQALPPDASRHGTVVRRSISVDALRGVLACEHRPPDPQRADIRFVPKLVAGGRGVGGPEGFAALRRIADKLRAGVAASRIAVDLGWIEPARQVGQTGRTVRPELYVACGISGASHHLEGMSESRHIVAINSDPQAPLMQRAELAIEADLHDVLRELDTLLESAV
jgi:electron transfer flavoprotein alpha subunit